MWKPLFLRCQSNTLLVNGYMARNHSKTSPLSAYNTKELSSNLLKTTHPQKVSYGVVLEASKNPCH